MEIAQRPENGLPIIRQPIGLLKNSAGILFRHAKQSRPL
jgi:hypothetical protein